MKGMGWTLIVLSICVVIWGCATPTSIHSDMSYVPGVGLEDAKDVLNIGLLQKQMMIFEGGLALFIGGVFAVCVGSLMKAMREAGTAKYESFFESLNVEAAEQTKEAVTE